MTTNNTIVAGINTAINAFNHGLSRHKAASEGQRVILKAHREATRKPLNMLAYALFRGNHPDIMAFARSVASVLHRAGEDANANLATYAAGLADAGIRGWTSPEVHDVTLRVAQTEGAPVWKGFTGEEDILAELVKRPEEEWAYNALIEVKERLHELLADLVVDYKFGLGGAEDEYASFPFPAKKGTWGPFMRATYFVSVWAGPGAAQRLDCEGGRFYWTRPDGTEVMELQNRGLRQRVEAQRAKVADMKTVKVDVERQWGEGRNLGGSKATGVIAGNPRLFEEEERLAVMERRYEEVLEAMEDPRLHRAYELMQLFNRCQKLMNSDFQLTLEVKEQSREQVQRKLEDGLRRAEAMAAEFLAKAKAAAEAAEAAMLKLAALAD